MSSPISEDAVVPNDRKRRWRVDTPYPHVRRRPPSQSPAAEPNLLQQQYDPTAAYMPTFSPPPAQTVASFQLDQVDLPDVNLPAPPASAAQGFPNSYLYPSLDLSRQTLEQWLFSGGCYSPVSPPPFPSPGYNNTSAAAMNPDLGRVPSQYDEQHPLQYGYQPAATT
jgi:hypothetical protein